MKTYRHRFVKEYANYKTSVLEDLAKAFPEKAEPLNGRIIYINNLVQRWQDGLILTDECMELIAKA